MTEEVKKNKTFKDYYNDPEWRDRHLKRLSEKIKCECGAMVSRSNMLRHKTTKKHIKTMVEPADKDKIAQLIELLKKDLKK